MKKRIISLILAVCMTLGLAACNNAPVTGAGKDEEGKEGDAGLGLNFDLFSGAGTDTNATSEIMTVTINGEKYDLSDDFQKVVGEMVKNGLQPMNPQYMKIYDENGKYMNHRDTSDLQNAFYAWEVSYAPTLEFSTIIVDRYEFRNSWKHDYTFETVDGITQDSDADDLEVLEGYQPCRGLLDLKRDACRAIYVDGKIVDLEEYRDVYEEWLKEAEENGYSAAFEKYLTGLYANELILGFPYHTVNVEDYAEQISYLEKNMLMAFAYQEAAEALEAGEIRSVDIIWYEENSEGLNVNYIHYYSDENWDRDKFRPEEQ